MYKLVAVAAVVIMAANLNASHYFVCDDMWIPGKKPVEKPKKGGHSGNHN